MSLSSRENIMRVTRRSLLWFVLLACTRLVLAQTAEVTRNVNLRADPSTDNPPIRLLTPPEVVTLLEPDKTAGYYHVRTAANEEGWVWGPNVNVQTIPAPTPTPTGAGAGAPASAIDPNWPKPTPVEITFHAGSGTCGPDGTGDTATNHLKNRVDVPPDYHAVTFGAVTSLPKLPPGSPTKRSSPHWPTVAPQITPLEGVPISVVGFIFSIKPQGAEGTNCSFTGAGETDWHVPFVLHSGDLEKTAIVVELTPRVHKDHPNWTTANLTPSGPKPSFRISGWLMFDPDHPAHLGHFRQTLWEVHPVMKIEVEQGGVWKDLDEP
jgi:hypothetical protein